MMLLELGNSKLCIGEIIKVARLLRGLGQIQLAQSVGLTQGYISKIEAGKIDPSAIDWFKISSFLEFSPDSLLWGYPELYIPRPSSAEAANRVKFPAKYVGADAKITLRFMYPIIAHLESKVGSKIVGTQMKKFCQDLEFSSIAFRIPFLTVTDEFVNLFFDNVCGPKKMSDFLNKEISPKSATVITWGKEFLIQKEDTPLSSKLNSLLQWQSQSLHGLKWKIVNSHHETPNLVELTCQNSYHQLQIKDLVLPFIAGNLVSMINNILPSQNAVITESGPEHCKIQLR